MEKLSRILNRIVHSTVAAVVVMTLLATIALNEVQQQGVDDMRFLALVICERDNQKTTEVNRRDRILKDFMIDAARTRESAAKISRAENNKKEYELNKKAAETYRANAQALVPYRLLDCQASIKAGKPVFKS